MSHSYKFETWTTLEVHAVCDGDDVYDDNGHLEVHAVPAVPGVVYGEGHLQPPDEEDELGDEDDGANCDCNNYIADSLT